MNSCTIIYRLESGDFVYVKNNSQLHTKFCVYDYMNDELEFMNKHQILVDLTFGIFKTCMSKNSIEYCKYNNVLDSLYALHSHLNHISMKKLLSLNISIFYFSLSEMKRDSLL